MKAAAVLWLAWLAFAIGITWPGFLWEIHYFQKPGPMFYRAVVGVVSVSPLLLAAWHFIRRRWWQYEFALLAALPVVACLVYEPRTALVVSAVVIA